MLAAHSSFASNGNHFPRSKALKLNRHQTFQRVEFSRFTTVRTIDVFMNVPEDYPLRFKTRSSIKEVVFADEVLIIVTASGMARAYNLNNGELLSNLNPTSYYTVQTVVYNRHNDTIIIVYAAHPGQLQCIILDLDPLMRGIIRHSSRSKGFGTVILKHPGFFEFDDVNGRIGAAILQDQRYEFWDMKDYKKAFEIKGDGDKYHEMRVSDGLLAMFKLPTGNFIPVSLYEIQNGQRLVKDFLIHIDAQKDMVLLELCCKYLLLKQKDSCLRIFNLMNKNSKVIKGTREFCPIGFVFYDCSRGSSQSLTSDISRNFMTISTNLLEFWQLSDCYVNRFRRIELPGLIGPEFVSHSNCRNIVAAYVSGTTDMNSNGNKISYFQSAKDFFQWKGNNEVESIVNNCNDDSGLSNNSSKTTGIYFFDMIDGKCLGQLNEGDDSVLVLSSTLEKYTIAMGCSNGIARIIRIPRSHDIQPFMGLFLFNCKKS